MDIQQIRTFMHVADLRSITRAARVLKLSQPALSRHIAQLEHALGTRLFHRTGHGVTLTADGAALVEHGGRILAELEAVRRRTGGRRAGPGPTGTVGIGLPLGISPLLAHPFLASCQARLPGVSLRMVEGFSALLHEWLLSGSVDLAILYGQRRSRLLDATPIAIEDLYAIMAPTTANLARTHITLRELAAGPLIVPHPPHCIRDLLHEAGVQPTELVEVDAMSMMIELARLGRGVTILSRPCVEPHAAAGQIALVPIQHPSLSWSVSVAEANQRPLSPAAVAVRTLVGDAFAALIRSGRWPARLAAGSVTATPAIEATRRHPGPAPAGPPATPPAAMARARPPG